MLDFLKKAQSMVEGAQTAEKPDRKETVIEITDDKSGDEGIRPVGFEFAPDLVQAAKETAKRKNAGRR